MRTNYCAGRMRSIEGQPLLGLCLDNQGENPLPRPILRFDLEAITLQGETVSYIASSSILLRCISTRRGARLWLLMSLIVLAAGLELSFVGLQSRVVKAGRETSARLLTTSSLQLSAAAYSVAENAGSVAITVIRTGDHIGAITVDYVTDDGSATARTDYTITSGTLSFAAGEASKTFSIPIADDTYEESSETFYVILSNATGAGLLAPSIAIVTITDNDTPPLATANAMEDARFFVLQHYSDFLSRPARSGRNRLLDRPDQQLWVQRNVPASKAHWCFGSLLR